jgi:DNA invertase Pin-like site-specific DNA recombinase
LKRKGVTLKILDFGGGEVSTETSMGKLFLTMVGGFAEFERDIMLERQRIGIAKAKAEGKYRGREPKARNQAPSIRILAAQGVTKTEIAKTLKISERSVYRVLEGSSAFA